MKSLLKIFLIFVFCGFLCINSVYFSDAAQQSDSVNVEVVVTQESSCNSNGVCEPTLGEDSISCPDDCNPDNCDPHGDINKSGQIDLVDFSILMFFWNQTDPENPCADINRDGIVDLIDFSIMMYYWS